MAQPVSEKRDSFVGNDIVKRLFTVRHSITMKEPSSLGKMKGSNRKSCPRKSVESAKKFAKNEFKTFANFPSSELVPDIDPEQIHKTEGPLTSVDTNRRKTSHMQSLAIPKEKTLKMKSPPLTNLRSPNIETKPITEGDAGAEESLLFLELQLLKKKLHEKEMKNLALMDEVRSWKNQFSDLENDYQEVMSQKETLSRKIEDDYFEMKIKQMEANKLKVELARAEALVVSLRDQVAQGAAETETLKVKLDVRERENRTLLAQISELRKEKSRLESETSDMKWETMRSEDRFRGNLSSAMKKAIKPTI